MKLAQRIRQLRQDRHWTQAELAAEVGVHQNQISMYERGVNIPPTDVLVKLAEVFNVTVDHLALTGKPETVVSAQPIQDRELLRRFETADTLPPHDKQLVMELVDLLAMRRRFQEMMHTTAVTNQVAG
jgi:transcriptional regulator with XRE-family HTH domain